MTYSTGWWLCGKEIACQCRRHGFHLCFRKNLEKEVAIAAISLPGESHGERSPAGYSPESHKRVRHNWVSTTQLDDHISMHDIRGPHQSMDAC